MFDHASSVEELKKLYHSAALANHPDKGGSVEAMQKINLAYEEAYQRLSHKPDGAGVGEMFVDVISAIVNLDGIKVEIMGAWIWVSGNTYAVKTELKAAGFQWARRKRVWFWRPPEMPSLNRSEMSLDDIRYKYGSQTVSDRTPTALSA